MANESTTGALGGDALDGLGEADVAAAAPGNAIEDLGHGRLFSQAVELVCEVLLERLAGLCRSAL